MYLFYVKQISQALSGYGFPTWSMFTCLPTVQCGGVLINRQHVVTAGHCIKNKRIEQLNVTLGEYNIGESLAAGEKYPSQTYKVQAMVVHPRFQFSPAADRLVHFFLISQTSEKLV